MKPIPTYFEDGHFLDQMAKLLTEDASFLEDVAPLLETEDFKPLRGVQWSQERWVIADRALTYYKKFHVPVGKLLRADVLEYAQGLQLVERQVDSLDAYIAHLEDVPVNGADAIAEKVMAFKGQHTKAATIQEMIDLQATGQLSDEKWIELSQKAITNGNLNHDVGCLNGPSWPEPLGPAALHGPVGEFVKLIEPHTEADLAAIAVQFLVAFGSVIGRLPFYRVEATSHHTNLFAVMVGRTGKSRKGTSWDHVRELFRDADPDWGATRLLNGGLASGEGLITLVRDSIMERHPVREKGKPIHYEDIEIPGELDKRLLVIEPEFARVLAVCSRDSNTLSALIRQAWDSGDLNNLTKHQRMSSHDAHISIIGHITAEELRRCITDTALANGFANRFLWVCAQRSKELPDGGNFNPESADALKVRKSIEDAVEYARNVEKMKRSEKAGHLWHKEYSELSQGRPGLLGAVTSRAEAQVVRLSGLYALLDRSTVIKIAHLQAALEVWRYCDESAQFIFGNTLGDPTADEILHELRRHPNGLTRNQMREHFKRNKRSVDITRALTVLAEHGLASMSKGNETAGQIRPTERWNAE